jgi:sugar lactone lactonase YvrE
MRKRWVFLLVGAVAFAGCDGDDDDDDNDNGDSGRVTAPVGTVLNFGPVPMGTADCTHPEGVAVDDEGNVWAGSVPGAAGATSGPARICKLNGRGEVIDRITVDAVSTGDPQNPGIANIGGLFFAPGDALYFTDFGDFDPTTANKRVLRLNTQTRAVTVLHSDFRSPNAITRDAQGNLYVSDSAEGAIYRLANDAVRTKTLWKQDPLLATANAALPFGANGLAFDANRQFLYVANTGDATIVRIARNADGTAGAATVVASNATVGTVTGLGGNALLGADGIAFDNQGNLYVCANQANEIQVLSLSGTTPQITQRFSAQPGSGNELSFPASIAFRGDQAYVANLAFATPGPAGKLSIMGTPNPGASP